jgi:hypothetical protein
MKHKIRKGMIKLKTAQLLRKTVQMSHNNKEG